MNSKHRKALVAIFTKPTLGNIMFSDMEALLLAIGCTRTEGEGARVRFDHGQYAWLAHRPHPGKEAKRYQAEQVREFLTKIGVAP
jgi:hypothetical protein